MKPDEHTIGQLDFDLEAPCESTANYRVLVGGHSEIVPVPDCESSQPATWAVVRKCCSDKRPPVGYLCDSCLQRKINHGFVACPVCNTRYSPTVTAWVRIERIR